MAGDLNGYVEKSPGDFGSVHRGNGYSKRERIWSWNGYVSC